MKVSGFVHTYILTSFLSKLCFFPEIEFCETPPTLCSGYQTDMHSVSRHGYQLEMGSDVDTETEGAASPDHALRMWIRGMKSEHSSCLSSRANSALSLTDTDHERKSDGENGKKATSAIQMKFMKNGFPLLLCYLSLYLPIFHLACRIQIDVSRFPGTRRYLSIWQIDTIIYNDTK